MAETRRHSAPRQRAVFRLEMGGITGWGHLARCAALAAELRRRGWACDLWTASDPSRAPEDLRAPFLKVINAGTPWDTPPPPAVMRADWIVVDDYSATDDALRQLRIAVEGAAPKLLAIDDEATRRLAAADLVVNMRLGLSVSPYASHVRTCLGERHALLRPGLRHPAEIVSPFPARTEPVLVMLGGTDPRGLTTTVVRAIAAADAQRFAPVVIRSRAGGAGEGILHALGAFPDGVWLEGVDAAGLAGWAGVCRYAISAAGGTLYELALLGLPFVGVVVAENQRQFGAEVAQRWRMPVVTADESFATNVEAALRELASRSPQSGRPIGGIDDRGAARVADALDGC